MAFLAGTPGEERFAVFDDLKQQLMKLTSPIKKVFSTEDSVSENVSKSVSRLHFHYKPLYFILHNSDCKTNEFTVI